MDVDKGFTSYRVPSLGSYQGFARLNFRCSWEDLNTFGPTDVPPPSLRHYKCPAERCFRVYPGKQISRASFKPGTLLVTVWLG